MFHLFNNPGRTAICNEGEFLFFSGYSYLGVQHNEEFINLINEGIKKYGWLFPSSRISNTRLPLFEEFELLLATITNTVQTISFSSGFSAGTVASRLFSHHPLMVCPTAHTAVNKINQPYCDFATWAEQTATVLQTKTYLQKPVLIADSVNPLIGTINNFDFLSTIHQPIIVIIDDSHGIGLLGNNGEGIGALLPQKENVEYILCYSLSKAFGINGGAISCTNKSTAQLIENIPEFTASTAISPAIAFAFIHAQHVYQKQRNILQKNIQQLNGLLATTSVSSNNKLPIFILQEDLDENYFAQHNIIISSFAYPNPQGRKINRAVVNALHTNNDLFCLSKAIIQGL